MFEITAYAAVWAALGMGVGAVDRLVNGRTRLSRFLIRGGVGAFVAAVVLGPVLQVGWA